MADITLSKAVRSNLLNLQSTAEQLGKTQERLATGKKVNSALDNPTNFFTASSLDARASDMSQLLDSMSNGIQTIEAADNGLTAITNTLESMQSTLTQARQDKSFKATSYTVDTSAIGTSTAKNISFSGGSVGSTAVDVALNTADTTAATAGTSTAQNAYSGITLDNAADSLTFDVAVDGGSAQTITFTAATVTAAGGDGSDGVSIDEAVDTINNQLTGATASQSGGKLVITSDTTGTSSTVAVSNFAASDGGGTDTLSGTADLGFGTPVEAAGTASSGDGSVKTVDQLVDSINTNTSLTGKIRASNDNGKLRIENLSTQDLSVTGYDSTSSSIDGGTGTSTIGGNTVRADLADQYNTLRDQLDKLSDDASFNGINLLRGDNLTITFNETGTSQISIQAKDGKAVNSSNLGLQTSLSASDLDSDTGIDGYLGEVKTALGTVRSQSSAFGSNLSVVQNRQDFTKNMINTLQTGASNLTLADTNEEAANLLALQTRQQLSSTALSLASQADQNVLRLF